MFVRRKPNRSGSVSVQVISKVGAKNIVVKSLGVARTEEKILALEKKAQEYIRSAGGAQLPLWESDQQTAIQEFLDSLSNQDIQLIGPELIYGKIYDRIGYGKVQAALFRHLVIARLSKPGSKLETIDYLQMHMNVEYRIDQIYRFLDNLCWRDKKGKKDIKEEIEQITYAYTKQVVGGDIGVVFYDMTTLYFEASSEDDLRRTGFSKDGKHSNPQIFLGLLVAKEGNPIGYEVFEGNIFEGHTLIPVLKRMEAKFELNRPVVVADAGLLSKSNLAMLEKEGYRYILGARIKNESQKVKAAILDFKMRDGDIRIIEKSNGIRLILSKTEKRAKKDAQNRQRGLQRLQKRIKSGLLTKEHINNRGYNKFITMKGRVEISIDESKVEAEAAWDGIKGYITNTDLPETMIIENYSYLWFVERAFRMNKTDLRVRPIYHRIRNRIEGHILICFVAYAILLELDRLLKKSKSSITLKEAAKLTLSMKQITYVSPDTHLKRAHILKMNEFQQELFNLVNSNS